MKNPNTFLTWKIAFRLSLLDPSGETRLHFLPDGKKIDVRLRQAVAGGTHPRRIYFSSLPPPMQKTGMARAIPDFWSKWRDSNSRHPAPKYLVELFSNLFRSFLAPFIQESMLFETLVSTVSVYSKTEYGQQCGQKPLPAQFGKRFVHSEDLFEAILPGRLHHLLYTGGERFHMFWANSAEIVPQRCLGEF